MPNEQPQQPQQPQQTPKSQVAPVTSGAPDSTAQKLDLLLQLLMAKEARIAEKELNDETSRKARSAQRELSARTHVDKQMVKQARCRHLKGGAHGPKSGTIDYCVSLHTYVNGVSIIKCLICSMKWRAQDTVEFLVRGSRKIANHTKMGWAQAQGMLAQSTNRPSSSEVPMQASPIAIGGDDTL